MHTCYHQRKGYNHRIMDRDNHTCQVCGSEAQEVDHIIPWATSHDSSPTNLRAICIKCNRKLRRPRKDACLPLDDWASKIEAELRVICH